MHKNILRLAVPNIISNITIPLLGAVDLAMMGRLDNVAFMGAIALGAMIFNILYWGMGFLRMGTSGFTAQSYGAGQPHECTLVLSRALLLAVAGSLLLIGLQQPILDLALLWLKPEAEVMEPLVSYFKIRIWVAPATISSIAFSGWFIGMQNTKIPMWIAIIVNICNIVFNYIFVFLLGWDAAGVAMGTLVSQYLGMGLYIVILRRKYARFLVGFSWKALWDWKPLLKFLHVNSDIFLRTLLIITVFSFFTAESSTYGNDVLVLNTLLYQFFIFFSYAMDGFAHAAEALTGRFVGSEETEQRKKSVRCAFVWGGIMTGAFFLVYFSFFDGILRLFTQDATILAMSADYFYWILAITLISCPAFLWDGVYAGSLNTKAMLWTMLLAVSGFFGFYYGWKPGWGNHAMWLAMLMFLVLRGGSMTALYPFLKIRKKE